MSGARRARLLPTLAGLAAAVLLPAAALRAQDPVPRDTLPPEAEVVVDIPDEAVRADTLPEAGRPASAAADSLVPAPNFPRFPAARGGGFTAASWVFGPAELGRFHGLSLLELLDRIPGLPIVREGDFGRPAGVGAFGAGGGRLRVFVDGWELRALSAASPELQHIPLLDVEEVRITRGLAETRVDVQTLRLDDARPFARIEGAEGDFATRVLRGLFARPFGSRVMVYAGLDVAETGGFRRRSQVSQNTAMGRVSWLAAPGAWVQLDYRTTAIDAERTLVEGAALPRESFDRSELVLRARGRLGGALWLDAALGRSRVDRQANDEATPAASSSQAMLRAALDVPLGTLSAAARLHRGDADGYAADRAELAARAELVPRAWLAAWGEARAITAGGVSGGEVEVAGRAGPFGGASLFASAAAGSRGLPFARDTAFRIPTLAGAVNPAAPDSVLVEAVVFRTRESTLAGFRAGGEVARGSAVLGAAFVAQQLGAWVPFGFAYDRGLEPVDGGAVGALEGYLSLPLLWRPLRLDVHYTDFLGQPARPYLPARFGRAALEYHGVYRDGNLEPTLRAEVVARGAAVAPNPSTGAVDTALEPYALFNLYVQVRVLDVRAFWRMENVVNRTTAADVPGLPLPGNRSMFGVRWFFRD